MPNLAKLGHVKVGWSSARVEVLPARRLMCYRCLEAGHISAFGRGIDRSDQCFRCRNQRNLAKACEAESSCCALCADSDKPADHRLGSGVSLNRRTQRSGTVRGRETRQKEKGEKAVSWSTTKPWSWRRPFPQGKYNGRYNSDTSKQRETGAGSPSAQYGGVGHGGSHHRG